MKVNKVDIDTAMKMLVYKFHHFEDTRTVVCMSFAPDGYHIGTGISDCIDPREFNIDIANNIARDKCIKDSEDRVWVIEGIKLRQRILNMKNEPRYFL